MENYPDSNGNLTLEAGWGWTLAVFSRLKHIPSIYGIASTREHQIQNQYYPNMSNIPPFAIYSTTRGASVVRTGSVSGGRVCIERLLHLSSGAVSAGATLSHVERPFLRNAAPRLTPLPPSVMTRLEAGFEAIVPHAWLANPTLAVDPEPEEDEQSETESEYDESEYEEDSEPEDWEEYETPEYEEATQGLPRYEDVPPPSYDVAILTPPMYEPSPRHMRASLAAAAAARRMQSA